MSRSPNPSHTIFDNIPVQIEEFARFMVEAFRKAGYHTYAVRCSEEKGVDYKTEQF